jgi:hypothetical protein
MFVNLLVGYTINRVTLFALILSLGLLVDDPITDVENIARYFAMRILPPREAVLRAVQEVRPALILSTLGDHRQLSAADVHHGHDGAVHGADGLERPADGHVFHVGHLHAHALAGAGGVAEINDSPGPAGRTVRSDQAAVYRISRALLGPVLNRTWLSLSALGLIGLLFLGPSLLPACASSR